MLQENNNKKMEDFYNSLNENQKNRVENKVNMILKESVDTLPKSNVDLIRYQIAMDMFQILRG